MNEVTHILSAIEQGDAQAARQLLPLVYDELRKLAAEKMAMERPGRTLQATALVHEAYLRLVDVKRAQKWSSRRHFFAAAAEAMRRILIENARSALLSRHQLASSLQVHLRSQRQPVNYVVFDVVRHAGRSLWGEPLRARRALLEELLERWQEPRVLLSTGIVGDGRRFFQRMVSRGHEGVMAKHLASRYLPGRRSAAWRKIKPIQALCAVIVEYVPGRHGPGTFRSLLVAAPRQGRLAYVATLRAGFTAAARADLEPRLARRQRRQPLVPCPYAGVWSNRSCTAPSGSWNGRAAGACAARASTGCCQQPVMAHRGA